MGYRAEVLRCVGLANNGIDSGEPQVAAGRRIACEYLGELEARGGVRSQ